MGPDAFVPHDGVTVHLNPHDGQVGRVETDTGVFGREVVHDGLDTCSQCKRHDHHQHQSRQ